MRNQIIYITANDVNWLKGLEYFTEEWQMDYEVVQYKTVKEVDLLPEIKRKFIKAIIVDWELNPDKSYMKNCIEKLEITFPFIPIISLSDNEFKQYNILNTYINKKTNDPGDTFNSIITLLNFYNANWINDKINRIAYSVSTLNKKFRIDEKEDKLFYSPSPITARQNAIEWFMQNRKKACEIRLFAFITVPEIEQIIPSYSVGSLNIYSDFLIDREIFANLNAEYKLYKLLNLKTFDNEQLIQCDNTIQFNVLRGIANDSGNILLR